MSRVCPGCSGLGCVTVNCRRCNGSGDYRDVSDDGKPALTPAEAVCGILDHIVAIKAEHAKALERIGQLERALLARYEIEDSHDQWCPTEQQRLRCHRITLKESIAAIRAFVYAKDRRT